MNNILTHLHNQLAAASIEAVTNHSWDYASMPTREAHLRSVRAILDKLFELGYTLIGPEETE